MLGFLSLPGGGERKVSPTTNPTGNKKTKTKKTTNNKKASKKQNDGVSPPQLPVAIAAVVRRKRVPRDQDPVAIATLANRKLAAQRHRSSCDMRRVVLSRNVLRRVYVVWSGLDDRVKLPSAKGVFEATSTVDEDRVVVSTAPELMELTSKRRSKTRKGGVRKRAIAVAEGDPAKPLRRKSDEAARDSGYSSDSGSASDEGEEDVDVDNLTPVSLEPVQGDSTSTSLIVRPGRAAANTKSAVVPTSSSSPIKSARSSPPIKSARSSPLIKFDTPPQNNSEHSSPSPTSASPSPQPPTNPSSSLSDEDDEIPLAQLPRTQQPLTPITPKPPQPQQPRPNTEIMVRKQRALSRGSILRKQLSLDDLTKPKSILRKQRVVPPPVATPSTTVGIPKSEEKLEPSPPQPLTSSIAEPAIIPIPPLRRSATTSDMGSILRTQSIPIIVAYNSMPRLNNGDVAPPPTLQEAKALWPNLIPPPRRSSLMDARSEMTTTAAKEPSLSTPPPPSSPTDAQPDISPNRPLSIIEANQFPRSDSLGHRLSTSTLKLPRYSALLPPPITTTTIHSPSRRTSVSSTTSSILEMDFETDSASFEALVYAELTTSTSGMVAPEPQQVDLGFLDRALNLDWDLGL
ncbi:hypothetical protein DFS34DRAFT_592882 [Phlyctochytrium arcticum]|nr:hypothetical protein DFS34DRAFT_592882 [Phlyctochytrium arcticum]